MAASCLAFESSSSSLCLSVVLHCVWVKFFIVFEWSSSSLTLSEVPHCVWVKFFFITFEWSSSLLSLSEVLHCVWVKFFIVFEWSSSFCVWDRPDITALVLLHYGWVKFYIVSTFASIYLPEVFVGSSDQWQAPERSRHVSEKCQGASRKCFDFFLLAVRRKRVTL